MEESNLAVQISAIRRVLSQAPGGERWVETLARRGYRFVGPVNAVSGAPELGAAGGIASNLPEPLTSFIGRGQELVEVEQALTAHRLVTIVGVGGIGKTRLALRLAVRVAANYRDGVWLVDLAPIADPVLVPSAIAQALGLGDPGGNSPIETLCRQLRSRRLLLLLDNCEHVLGASAALVDALLHATRDLAIVATSRERLHVAGEQTYPLVALSLPDATVATAEDIAASEAVQLFVDRARLQLPDFTLNAARARTAAELCIHLDGIPLALELAAARIRTLSIEQIAARLDDRFKVLTSAGGNAPRRHRTLRATLDWSYDMLAEQQRVVLRRLGIFAGGFGLDAASAVASDGSIDEFAVIDLLSQLVERSLIWADTRDPKGRYGMLETTRAYILEKLAEAGEANAARRRHAEHFRDVFETAASDSLRMSDAEWRPLYLPELDNVRRALDWALNEGGDTTLGIALAGASRAMWVALGLLWEGRQWLELALSRADSSVQRSDLARLWLSLGILLESPAPAQSVANFERAIDLYRRLGDRRSLGYALVMVARPLAQMGLFERSASALAEAAPIVERSGLAKLRAFLLAMSGFLKNVSGDHVGARADCEKSLQLCLESGTDYAAPATVLGDLTWTQGDLDAAAAAFQEVVAMMRRSTIPRRAALGYALANLAGVLTERGDLDAALAAAREGLPLLTEGGGLAWRFMDHLALLVAGIGRFAGAARLAGFADASFVANGGFREPNEARSHARVHALLRESPVANALAQLLAEGAELAEDEACSIVLQD